jgi:two-component system, OmpR family, sensor kinase
VTLRIRLIVVFTVIVVVVCATGFAIYTAERGYLVDQIDRQLLSASRPIQQLPTSTEAPRFTPAPAQPQVLSELWIGEVGFSGRLKSRAAPLSKAVKQPAVTAVAIEAAAGHRPFTVGARGGQGEFRMLAVARPADGGVIAIGLSLDGVDRVSSRLRAFLGLAGAAILLVTGLLCWWVWRLGLRPIRRMTETADSITRGDRSLRIEGPSANTEAGHLAIALNTMLDERQRIEDQLRQFVGDASHELRTPLTSIRGYVDLYRRGGLEEPGKLADAMRRVGQESARMTELVDDLLLLARLDQGRPLASDRVDLATVLRDAATDAGAIAPDRHVSVELAAPIVVTGDEARLRQVVAALVSNSLSYTDGSIVLRALRPANGLVGFEVVDDGPGIPAEFAAHAFERFRRGDSTRSRARGGAGLGLAIVSSVVSAHRGSVDLVSDPASGTVVRVCLPAAGVNGDVESSNR